MNVKQNFQPISEFKQYMNRSHRSREKKTNIKYSSCLPVSDESHLLFHIRKQPPNLGSQMNHMRRLIFLEYFIGIPPHSQVAVLGAEEDPRLARFGVGIGVGFDGLTDETGTTGDEDGGDGVSFCVVFGHIVVFWEEIMVQARARYQERAELELFVSRRRRQKNNEPIKADERWV